MSGTCRMFVAVEVPEAVARRLDGLRRSLGLPGDRWRHVPPESMHLTLAFLGDVPTSAIGPLGHSLRGAAAPLSPFEVAVTGLDAFPEPSRCRVLIAAIGGPGLDHLHGLHAAVVAACRAAGAPPADPRFHPHVTLARKSRGPGPPPGIFGDDRCRDLGGFRVDRVRLVESTLRPSGPRYATRAVAELTGGRP